jgi:hypothetical protein
MRGHERSIVGNQLSTMVIIMEFTIVEIITVDNVSMEVNMMERSSNQDREMETEVLIIRKRPQVKEESSIYIHCLLRLPRVIVKCV